MDDLREVEVGADGADLNVQLWSRRPSVAPVLPVFPGANLIDARFQDDGSVALEVGLPISTSAINSPHARELWRLDPVRNNVSRVQIAADRDFRPPVLAVSPGGLHMAFVAPEGAAPGGLAKTAKTRQGVWTTESGGSAAPRLMFVIEPESRVTGLSWDASGQRLIVFIQLSGEPARTALVLLDTVAPGSDTGQTLITIPASVVPGSESWDPNGRWLAFMARSKASGGGTVVSLCAIETRPDGAFRYIADLGSPHRVPVVPAIAWDQAGTFQAAIAAPIPAPASGSPGPLDLFSSLRPAAPPLGLFVTSVGDSADATPRRLSSTTGLSGLLWQSERRGILGVGRGDDSLVLRLVDPNTGAAKDLDVHVPTDTGRGSGLGVRWDERHGRALMLTRASTTDASPSSQSLKAWLVDFVDNAAVRMR